MENEGDNAGRDCRTRLAIPNSQARTRTEKYLFSCPDDHEKDSQPHPVDPYSAVIIISDDHAVEVAGL